MNILKYKRLSCNALPLSKVDNAAGVDICSIEDVVLQPKTSATIKTGIAIMLPKGTYGRLATRSGLSMHGLNVGAGVIDNDYRGEVKVIIFNHGCSAYKIKRGDRIAQVVCENYTDVILQEVQEITTSQRGARGFGSSGK